MTYFTDTRPQTDHAPAWRHPLGLLRRAWDGLVALSAANERLREVKRLQALSDDELARLGLRREDIVRTVFADKFYL